MQRTQLWMQLLPTNLGFWLGLDLLIGFFWYWAMRTRTHPRFQRWYRSFQFIRWVLPVYVALLFGILSPRALGLNGIDWSLSLGNGSLLLLVLGASGIVVGRYFLSPIQTLPDAQAQSSLFSHVGESLLTILLSGGREAHWAFWRGGMAEIVRILLESLFWRNELIDWGAWVAVLPLATELLVVGRDWLDRLLLFILLLTTTILFVYTHNFWLCWGLHATLSLLWPRPARS